MPLLPFLLLLLSSLTKYWPLWFYLRKRARKCSRRDVGEGRARRLGRGILQGDDLHCFVEQSGPRTGELMRIAANLWSFTLEGPMGLPCRARLEASEG